MKLANFPKVIAVALNILDIRKKYFCIFEIVNIISFNFKIYKPEITYEKFSFYIINWPFFG